MESNVGYCTLVIRKSVQLVMNNKKKKILLFSKYAKHFSHISYKNHALALNTRNKNNQRLTKKESEI